MVVPAIEKKALWIGFGILTKTILYFYLSFASINHYSSQSLYTETFGTKAFILPIENFLRSGSYIEDFRETTSQYIRMPGYGGIYLAFRFFTDTHTAKNLLVLLQIVLSGVSIYYLSLTAYRICPRKLTFYFCFVLYASSAFVSMYDGYLLSESLSVSTLIFSVYLIAEVLSGTLFGRSALMKLFCAGIWLTISVFMRPAAAPLFLLFIPFIVFRLKGIGWKIRAISLFGFIGIFCIAEISWITRNFRISGRIVPFQYNSWLHTTGNTVKDVEYHAYQWIQAVGESSIFYEYNTLSAWLFDSGFANATYQPPLRTTTSAYNSDSLKVLKAKFLTYRDTYGIFSSDISIHQANPSGKFFEKGSRDNQQAALELNQTFSRYTDSYRTERPMDYYVINRFRLLKTFLFHSGTGNYPLKSFAEMKQNKDVMGIFFKLSQSVLYWLVLLAGTAGVVVGIWLDRFKGLLLASLVSYTVLITPFYIKIPEMRFLCLAYPFLAVSAAICLAVVFFQILTWRRANGK